MAVGSFQSTELKTLLVQRQQVAPGHSPLATVLLREVHDQHLYLHNNIVILPLNLKTLLYNTITRLRHADHADLIWIIETFEVLSSNCSAEEPKHNNESQAEKDRKCVCFGRKRTKRHN